MAQRHFKSLNLSESFFYQAEVRKRAKVRDTMCNRSDTSQSHDVWMEILLGENLDSEISWYIQLLHDSVMYILQLFSCSQKIYSYWFMTTICVCPLIFLNSSNSKSIIFSPMIISPSTVLTNLLFFSFMCKGPIQH